MARRRKKSEESIGVMAMALAVLFLAFQLLISIPLVVWGAAIVGVGMGFVLFFRHKARLAEKQRFASELAESTERRTLDSLLARHGRTLCIRYSGLAAANGYGAPDVSAWAKEVQRFVISTGFKPVCLTPETIGAIVTTYVKSNRDQLFSSHAVEWTADAMKDPMAFEQACASNLQAMGWEANVTPGSGDHGIDVQAQKAGVIVVLQCKLHSQPVGNSAVQEALSGKAFASAHVAAVVSNAGFTRKAHELATATGVLLLHHSELGRIDQEAEIPMPPHSASNTTHESCEPDSYPSDMEERGLMGNLKKSARQHPLPT